jgi:pimeloyl-ACP methyl ester carboxylesterase
MLGVWVVAALAAVVLCAAYTAEKLAEVRDRRRYPAPGKRVDVGGRHLHILTRGSAPGPAVVIEQGIGGPSLMWWPVQEEVAKFARVCSYDRAGFLWSDPVAGERSIEDRVADLHTLLVRSGVSGPYVLVAHSMGGLLTKEFARAYPAEVAGIVLVDMPSETVLFRESSLRFYRQGVSFQKVLRIAARFGLIRVLAKRAKMLLLPEDRMGYALCVTPTHAAAVADDMHAMLTASDAVRTPLAAGAWGGRPLIALAHELPFPGQAAVLEEGWREGMRSLVAASTDSELIVAARSNHMIYLDEPELVVESIRRVHAAVRDRMRMTQRS